jgi:hypothetical protein
MLAVNQIADMAAFRAAYAVINLFFTNLAYLPVLFQDH